MKKKDRISILFNGRLMLRAFRDHRKLPTNKNELLNKFINSGEIDGYKIRYRYGILVSPKPLGANCDAFSSTIYIHIGWAYRLLIRNDSETKNAFSITLGHEFTHADGFTPLNVFHIRDLLKIRSWKFKFHTCEVYCDFGAAQKMAGCSKEKLIQSMNYKLKDKLSRNKEDKSGIDHPSWKQREKYARTGKFDGSLIRQIAKDTGCKNERLIREVCEFYKGKEIQLI